MSAEMARLLNDLRRRLSILERQPSPSLMHTAWVQESATLPGLTLSNGSGEARYKRLGTTVHYIGYVTLGTTSVVGASLSLDLPVTPAVNSARWPLGMAMFTDVSTGLYLSGHLRLQSPTTALFHVATGQGVAASSPFTFGAGDSIGWNITYEVSPPGV